MKRSEINAEIMAAQTLFADHGIHLPPFAAWSPSDWAARGPEADEIRDNGLGWDVTDFGSGDFAGFGLLLFTLRNGNALEPEKYPKTYCEKIMVVREDQITPTHFHWKKTEDIINRGGGALVIELFGSTPEETLAEEAFTVSVDGVTRTCNRGDTVILKPGESICLEPYVYHKFYGLKGRGPVVVGEVSAVNDDNKDNRFLEPLGRFPEIEEDEPPLHLLCTEYPPAAH